MSGSRLSRLGRTGPETIRPAGRRLSGALLVALGVTLGAVGCRQDMHDQPRYEPLEASTFFADGVASRPLVDGTVPRGFLREDDRFYRGLEIDESFVTELPIPLDAELLARGRTRFEAFCSPCHGRAGDGQGMVVQRGFRRPPSFHEDRLRGESVGYFFDVMTNGFGVMSSYASQMTPRDRWAVAAYLRALQLSQHAPPELLSVAEAVGAAPPAAAGQEVGHEH